MALLSACGGNEPQVPDNDGNNGGNTPTEEISSTDFVGAWVQDVKNEPIYRIFNSDLTGVTVLVDDSNASSKIRKQTFRWKYRNEILTLTLTSTNQVYTVVKISKKSMTLMDENGYKEIYRRINKSEVPGFTEGDDNNGDNPNNNGDDGGKDDVSPYANYMYIDGTYYEITKIQSSVHHATDYGDCNSKIFNFFGPNGSMKPIGFYIYYTRPSWDGIDDWTTGTYTVIAGGSPDSNKYYQYVGIGFSNTIGDFGAEGKFKISRSGDFTIYDFEGETYYPTAPFKIHVVTKR